MTTKCDPMYVFHKLFLFSAVTLITVNALQFRGILMSILTGMELAFNRSSCYYILNLLLITFYTYYFYKINFDTQSL